MKLIVPLILTLAVIDCSNSSNAASSKSSQEYPMIPGSPYGASAFLIDYGMLLEDYQYLLNGKLSNSTIRSALQTFIAPLKDYQTANKNVAQQQRKSHLIKLADYLASDDSFKNASTSNSNNTGMNGTDLSKVVKTRNSLISSAGGSSTQRTAQNEYQTGMKKYSDALQSFPASVYSGLIAKNIDWNLFESRYYQLVMCLQTNTDEQYIAKVRGYLAVFLRDNNHNDQIYQNLLTGGQAITPTVSMKRAGVSNAKTSTKTSKNKNTTTMTSAFIPTIFDTKTSSSVSTSKSRWRLFNRTKSSSTKATASSKSTKITSTKTSKTSKTSKPSTSATRPAGANTTVYVSRTFHTTMVVPANVSASVSCSCTGTLSKIKSDGHSVMPRASWTFLFLGLITFMM